MRCRSASRAAARRGSPNRRPDRPREARRSPGNGASPVSAGRVGGARRRRPGWRASPSGPGAPRAEAKTPPAAHAARNAGLRAPQSRSGARSWERGAPSSGPGDPSSGLQVPSPGVCSPPSGPGAPFARFQIPSSGLEASHVDRFCPSMLRSTGDEWPRMNPWTSKRSITSPRRIHRPRLIAAPAAPFLYGHAPAHPRRGAVFRRAVMSTIAFHAVPRANPVAGCDR